MNFAGISQGISQGLQDNQQTAIQQQEMAIRAQQLKALQLQQQQQTEQRARDQQARQNAAYALPALQPPPPQPPNPGQASVPMQMPGQGSPSGQPMPPGPQAMPQQPPPPMAIPPYRTVDSVKPPMPQQQPGPMAPPPLQTQGQPAPGANAGPFMGPSALDTAIANMQKAGVPGDQMLDVLEQPGFKSYLSEKDKQRVEDLRIQQEARQAAQQTYQNTLAERRLNLEDKRLQEQMRRDDSLIASRNKSTPAYDALSPEQQKKVDFYAEKSLNGDDSWKTGLARSKDGTAMIKAVMERVPDMATERGITPMETTANKADVAALTKSVADRTKFVAAATQFAKNMDSQIGLVKKYMEPGLAGSTPALNKWIQSGRKAIAGDPDVTALDVAMRGLAREHQRIVTGVTSNAQLHVSAQETADELLNTAQTPEQVRATLKVMKEEVKNAIDSGKSELGDLREQIKNKGKSKTDSDNVIHWDDLK